jgi:hypothetical protein
MSATKTLVGELLLSLRNNECQEKIENIIARLENLETMATNKIHEAELFEKAENYSKINHHLILDGERYRRIPVKVMVAPNKYKILFTFVKKYECCIENTQGVCCGSENKCNNCPFGPGANIPLMEPADDWDFVVQPRVNEDEIKSNQNNIVMDIEDIMK